MKREIEVTSWLMRLPGSWIRGYRRVIKTTTTEAGPSIPCLLRVGRLSY